GGAAARDVLVLQKLLPLLGQIAGSQRPLEVARMTVLPTAQTPGADVARLSVAATEQLKTVTGVDVAQLARGLVTRLDGALVPGPSRD
ncbi:MAG TPA: hypothetical protein VJU61_12550, partial [Polyangiaceae bacterium]|nr:hypothetical protein [Polyangiaceae bacterium]